ncbi:MAG: glucoamylase family protein [Chloroflexota bacterium]|nr:glucoamylase family protein [Chloroflexota bacterium]
MAHQLAAYHVIGPQAAVHGRYLAQLPRLEQQLQEAHQQFLRASTQELALSGASEWLLDNYYLVVEALRQIEEDLPDSYSRQLPRLAADYPLAGYPQAGQPRIYAVAYAFWMHEEHLLDQGRLRRFVAAYQQVHALTMGELWALPIMLRLALLETLAQAVGRITHQAPDTGVEDSPPAASGSPTAPNDGDTVANCIISLRRLNSQDWNRFFEEVSLVQQVLNRDPAGIYSRMDFASRDRYRGMIERLAHATGQDEIAIAQKAVALASASLDGDGLAADLCDTDLPNINPYVSRRAHVGYYLAAQGRPQLEEAVGYEPRGAARLRRGMLRHPTWVYLGGIGLLSGMVIAGFVAYARGVGASLLWQGAVALVTLIPALTLAVGLVNGVVSRLLPPRILPKLDFSEGVPAAYRTMVVVPCLISTKADVASLTSQLELHYLRNPDPHLSFALLSDFADAQQAEMPEDAALIDLATERIEELNGQYPGRPFYLFHRKRLWNAAQKSWMGWERKRGKLHEFNRLLRGHTGTSYNVQIGDVTILQQIRYVITLDADTILPRGEANRLVGALAHPLNRAEFDAETGEVIAGYTVLQPRTAIKPTSANQSLFTRVFTGDRGIDLYTRAVSDVYQDLFGAGIFVGKGIYDVDAFERSLAGRVPENAILSHDLFEGIHGRVGLATDILLYEDYPPHYLVNVLRSHRWVRGDWQLLPWLLPRVPAQDGWIRNDLAVIDRWKILDNLRRSLLAASLMLLLIAGWTVLLGAAWVWTLLAALTPAVPPLFNAALALAHGVKNSSYRAALRPLRDDALRWLLFVAFLPYEAQLMLDAILTTLGRLFTRKDLLQWTTAAHTVRVFGDEATPTATLVKMLPSTLAVAVLAVLVSVFRIQALLLAAPFFVVWLSASQIAHWISRPTLQEPSELTDAEVQQLRTLARRTWLFYEHFVGPDSNWLPPDHFQETPRGAVAQRTSPTNIGLYLLTALAAHDLGYVGMTNLVVRLYATFSTLEKMPRYRGHILNWVDTHSLETLPPGYVSTVDSGNMAGSLIAFKQGCLAMAQERVWRWEAWQGLLDLLLLLAESAPVLADQDGDAGNEADSRDAPTVLLLERLSEIRDQVLAVRGEPVQWRPLLAQIATEGQQAINQHFVDIMAANAGALNSEVLQNCRIYTDRIQHHLDEMQHEVDTLLPWLVLLNEPPAIFGQPGLPPSLAETWAELQRALPPTPKLGEIKEICRAGQSLAQRLSVQLAETTTQTLEAIRFAQDWCGRLVESLQAAQSSSASLLESYAILAEMADRLTTDMEFDFLFDAQRQLFHIGYNVDAGMLDQNYYDLLASEARIASLVAIAKYDVPQSHWIHLGRPLTRLETGEEALLSWSGTMFEYLMPSLLMHSYSDTLIHASASASIDHQIRYARDKKIPWGISESGFYTFDAAMNYQYHAFGVPGLGFKRGLTEDLVITPYASMLALPFHTQAVLQNIEALQAYQMIGRYGFYEALDFTPSHLKMGQTHATVRSYMTHHQGMIMLALVNRLQDRVMVQRFHAEPSIRSIEMLLQEQAPAGAPVQFPHEDEVSPPPPVRTAIAANPWPVPLDTPMPMAHYLSNGRYGVLISNAGGGYSRWHDVALTRWRADTTLDNWGSWLYVQDLERGALWSATRQPLAGEPSHEETLFFPHMASFRRREQDISLHLEICVAPDDDVEVRRITLINESDQPRRLRLTTYGEVALAPQAADQRHPAFAKLFVESEYFADLNALLFARRPRSAHEERQFLIHMLVRPRNVAQEVWGRATYESDRAAFLGRGRTAQEPQALVEGATPSAGAVGNTGPTLDPIMSLGQEIELPARATVQVAAVTLAAPSRQAALDLARRYRAWSTVGRVFTRSQLVAEAEMRELEMTTPIMEQAQQLLSLSLYSHAGRRADAAILNANNRGQSGLWPFGISGDYPIVLLRMMDETQAELLEDVLRAHTYWRRRGLNIDLVILNRQTTNYGQPAQDFIHRLIQRTGSNSRLNQRGGLFVLREDQISEAERILLHSVARAVLDAENGPLADQMSGLLRREPALPAFEPALPVDPLRDVTPPLIRPTDLQFDNGLGGFNADGEYVIYLRPGETTPAPWINVIANADFGCLVSETGAGYTWATNSGENRLTTWRNDPVSDMPAETVYLRDEETAEVWSPTPQPAPADAPYLVRHGAGYSSFEHNSHGLQQRMRVFVAPDAPVKIVQLRLENSGPRPRRFTITYYAEWVLGVDRSETQSHIVSEYVEDRYALLAHNGYSADFAQRVAFLAASKSPHGLTADRADFLGRLGTLRRPAALKRFGLNNRVDAGVDPCAVLQLHVDLAPGAQEEVYFVIGQGADREAAQTLIQRFQNPHEVNAAWVATQELWAQILGTVTVETPDPALNLLLNKWLLYQTLSCRVWGRSALYQSSGAYGFRDQLQDVMALIHARPELAREQILRAASHQFEAGDVLHWWHPPGGQGVRTRISDDLLWLPYVTAHYVAATGDAGILDEETPFLQGEPLTGEEEERYAAYVPAGETFTLFEHCRRALHKGTTAGPHDIPLIGGGDWNDGMNRVGIEGKGESIWLGWFLHAALAKFAALCTDRGDLAQASVYQEQADAISAALEANGWDGDWYRRAYYDDGTPLGSVQNMECRIDSIAQSWGVLSGAADSDRAARAMKAVTERLVNWDDGLILLFTPPFDKTTHDPGYIKGYLPGVRENGGQYTHAALWSIWALAELGAGDDAECPFHEQASALFSMLNPIRRTDTAEKARRYKVEPYVISADVYGVAPHVGRGGWTWYTGSSAWMYRLGIEAILGLQRKGQELHLDPCISKQWAGFSMTYRYGRTTYAIQVDNPEGVNRGVRQILLDGVEEPNGVIPLVDDAQCHQVHAVLGQG